jgi:hypothetical protein
VIVIERSDSDERVVYEIRVQGQLDEHWSDWFSDLAVPAENGAVDPSVTTLIGPLDQAALRGILCKLWDLNLTLVSVRRIEADTNTKEEEDD